MFSVLRDLIPQITVQHQQIKIYKWVLNILFRLQVVVSKGLGGGRVMVNEQIKDKSYQSNSIVLVTVVSAAEFLRSCHSSLFSQIPSLLSQ